MTDVCTFNTAMRKLLSSYVGLTLAWMVVACAVRGMHGQSDESGGERLAVPTDDDDDSARLHGDSGFNSINLFQDDQHLQQYPTPHPHFIMNADTDEILSRIVKRTLQAKPKLPTPVTSKSRPSWKPAATPSNPAPKVYPDIVIGRPSRLKGQGHQGHNRVNEARSRKRASLETLIARLTQMGGVKHPDNNRVSLVRFGPGRR